MIACAAPSIGCGVAFVDEVVVGALERSVSPLCQLLGFEEGPKDADLGLTHGVEHVLPRVVALLAGLGQPGGGGGRLECADDQAVVGDGGAGHVHDGQLNLIVRHRFFLAYRS